MMAQQATPSEGDPGWASRAFVLFQQNRPQAAERGKFLDCQALAQFRMSASRSLLELNASRLYISSLTAVSGNVA